VGKGVSVGTGVSVGGTGVAVGGIGVPVGGTGVAVGAATPMEHPINSMAMTVKLNQRIKLAFFILPPKCIDLLLQKLSGRQ
jgi:hypothetical protein